MHPLGSARDEVTAGPQADFFRVRGGRPSTSHSLILSSHDDPPNINPVFDGYHSLTPR
jgi:hypothetical protein